MLILAAAIAGTGCGTSEEEPALGADESELSSRASYQDIDINVALDKNGGVASSSGAHWAQPIWTVNDGRRGSPADSLVPGTYAYWASSTSATTYSCNYGNWWVRVDFNGRKTISEIDLFSLQDNYTAGTDPTTSTTTTKYGNVDHHLQYCPSGVTCSSDGTGWVEPPGGYVTNNNKAWTQVRFAPVVATAVRAVLDCAQTTRAYAVELEAWQRITPTVGGPYGLAQTYVCSNQIGAHCYDASSGPPLTTSSEVASYLDNAATNWGCDWNLSSKAPYQLSTGAWVKWFGTQVNNEYGCGVAWWNAKKQAAYFLPNSDRGGNVALAKRGAKVAVSSTYSSGTPASAIIDGNRRGDPWGSGGGWSSRHQAGYPTTSAPEWIQIDFDGSKTISEIVVTTIQDSYASPVEPYINQTFSYHGIRDFGVWYWNGTGWSVLQNIYSNNQVYRRMTFSPVTTPKIRINITKALDGAARVIEVEAYEASRTSSKLYAKYQGTNWDSGVLGMPISNPIAYGWANATYQLFENGIINYYRGNASAVAIGGTTVEDKALASRYTEHFNITPNHGPPIYATYDVANATDTSGASVGRYVQWYSNGNSGYEMIIARTGSQAFFVDSLVRSAWRSYGATHGGAAYAAEPDLGTPWRAPLGFPITENIVYQQGIDAASYHQEFERGAIVREPSSCSGAYTTSVKTLTNRPILAGYYEMLSCPSNANNNTYLTGNSASLPFNTGLKAGTFQFSAPDGGRGWFDGIEASVADQKQVNVATAAAGATVTTSSSYSSSFTGRGAIDGDRSGDGWGENGVWQDGTPNSWGDWLQVSFPSGKRIHRIDVYSPQDNYASPVQPTSTMTTTSYALSAFQVQYWTGAAWADVPNGNVTGNTKVWRSFTFTPITTSGVRVLVNNAAGGWSRIAEVEAWSTATAIVSVKGPLFDAWLGGASSTSTIVQAMTGASGTSGLGMPLGNAQCGDNAVCMQPFDNGSVSHDTRTGVLEVMSGGGSCSSCPKAPYQLAAIPKGYAHSDITPHACDTQLHDCGLAHDSNVWTYQDRRWGHKVELRWNNRSGQNGTTVKVYRIAKPLGATSWSATTQVGTFVLGDEPVSVFTDSDAVANARNCYNVWVENTYGGTWSNQFCAWTFDDRSFVTTDGNGNITGGEVARRSVPSPMGYMEIGLDVASDSDAGSKDPVWVSVGRSGRTHIRLSAHYGIDRNSHDFYPLTFTISDVSEVNDIMIGVAGPDNLKISGVTLKIDGVLAFQKSFATPLNLSFANSGVQGHQVASAEDLRLNNPLWTNVYRYNFRGERYNKKLPPPRNTGISGKGVSTTPGTENFKRKIDGLIIDGLLASSAAQQHGSMLKSGTTLNAVGGDRLQVTQYLRAHTGWTTLTDINCTIRYDLVLRAKDANNAAVPYDQNYDTGNGIGRIVKTELVTEPKGGTSGSDLVSCDTTWYQDLMVQFLGTFIGMGISGAGPLPTDWSAAGLGYLLSKFVAGSLAWTTIETMILDYADKMLTGNLKAGFSAGGSGYGSFPAGYHLCFPTTGGYTPLMNEARNGGVSVCIE